MRKIFWISALIATVVLYPGKLKAADEIPSLDSMDRIYDTLQKQSANLKDQIEAAKAKIEAAKAEKEKKPNYWIPIAGGAVLGIALAWWLKRKK